MLVVKVDQDFQVHVLGYFGHLGITKRAKGLDFLRETFTEQAQILSYWRDPDCNHGSSDGAGASMLVLQEAHGPWSHGSPAVDGVSDGIKFVHGWLGALFLGLFLPFTDGA